MDKQTKEWKGRLGCYCYDCWKWCKKGSREEWDTFLKKTFEKERELDNFIKNNIPTIDLIE